MLVAHNDPQFDNPAWIRYMHSINRVNGYDFERFNFENFAKLDPHDLDILKVQKVSVKNHGNFQFTSRKNPYKICIHYIHLKYLDLCFEKCKLLLAFSFNSIIAKLLFNLSTVQS